jgi:hypothetical protein
MTAETPLPLLACMVQTEPHTVSISTQKICKRGNPRGAITTHTIPLDAPADANLASEILKSFKKLRVYHHAQPEIEDVLNKVLADADLIALDNQFVCTRQIVEDTEVCDYDADIFELAQRGGVSASLIDNAQCASSALCEVYTTVFTSYIRNLREDIFGEPGPLPSIWAQTLSEAERDAIKAAPSQDSLPKGWTVEEAQSLWLMHQSGDDLASLASMVGQPEEVLASICALFDSRSEAA